MSVFFSSAQRNENGAALRIKRQERIPVPAVDKGDAVAWQREAEDFREWGRWVGQIAQGKGVITVNICRLQAEEDHHDRVLTVAPNRGVSIRPARTMPAAKAAK